MRTNATNEQMALVMDWGHDNDTYTWHDAKGDLVFADYDMYPDGFNPIADLNHTALVEQRLEDLGLAGHYISYLYVYVMHGTDDLDRRRRSYHNLPHWRLATAPAHIRCNAAWDVWEAYQRKLKQGLAHAQPPLREVG